VLSEKLKHTGTPQIVGAGKLNTFVLDVMQLKPWAIFGLKFEALRGDFG